MAFPHVSRRLCLCFSIPLLSACLIRQMKRMLRSLVRHPGEIVSMTHSHLEAFRRLQGGNTPPPPPPSCNERHAVTLALRLNPSLSNSCLSLLLLPSSDHMRPLRLRVSLPCAHPWHSNPAVVTVPQHAPAGLCEKNNCSSPILLGFDENLDWGRRRVCIPDQQEASYSFKLAPHLVQSVFCDLNGYTLKVCSVIFQVSL